MAEGNVSADQLKMFFERIERLEEEKKAIGDDVKDVFAEAKANGFDPKIMRKVLALKKKTHAERSEEQSMIETYMTAIGLSFDGTPLGEAAAKLHDSFEKTGADEVTVKVGDGPEKTVFERKKGKKQQVTGTAFPPLTSIEGGGGEKPKSTRKATVRDPSDGSEKLVTVPPAA